MALQSDGFIPGMFTSQAISHTDYSWKILEQREIFTHSPNEFGKGRLLYGTEAIDLMGVKEKRASKWIY